MLFNSLQYAVFLPIVFALYWALPHRYRQPVLLIASYYFYMSWNVKYVVLILFTTAVSYTAAVLLERTDRTGKRKLLLAATLVACLGVLFLFKYFNFFMGSLAAAAQRFAIPLHPTTLKLLLPVGISFYTFQTLSYVIDVYRGDVTAEKNFFTYALFVSFFPQLVAGPIERTKNLLPQLKAEHTFDYDQAMYGLKLMAWGYFKKAFADHLASYIDGIYANISGATRFDLIAAAIFFSIQIYCDFSGYSDIARGTAKLLGIDLMENFKSPYFSSGIREFWSRWHISLSTWFRDYVYIPLGGNRCSKLRHYANLLITFLVSGLWHGANWTFVVWGGLHGLGQIAEDAFGGRIPAKGKIARMTSIILVFLFCSIAWVFFRAESFETVGQFFRSVGASNPYTNLSNHDLGIRKLFPFFSGILLVAAFDCAALKRDVILWISKRSLILRWGVLLILVWLIWFYFPASENAEFVYFQF